MAKRALAPELVWLRYYVAEPCLSIELAIEAENAMRREGISLAELMDLLRTGDIIKSEKVYFGSNLTIKGSNCDDKYLEAVCWIECNTIQVKVVTVCFVDKDG